ncbi:cell wall hydrolase [Mesorhizobium sp. Root157]|uniref:cell wall hydrolase n=1 Tax=Mesorhizobium sp. Root157 TaxID=1736477 RepID=UPI000AD10CCF|nr:cell wall hydrolase [Mesorhizobium sp. Root157]
MIAKRWKTLCVLNAVGCLLLLAGCSQSTNSMSAANLADGVGPTRTSSYRYTMKDRECLQRAMFFESNRSSREGMVGVGTVVMNRLKSGRHGNTICSVVGEPRQFAAGVMTRPMNSKAMPDVASAAEAVLKGERHPKMKNAMFFHTAGLKFKYNNMHYVAVAGGNAFYEKRSRNWKPLPPDSTFQVAAASPSAQTPATPSKVATLQPAKAKVVVPASSDRDPVMTASVPEVQPVMAFEQTPDDTSSIGALIIMQGQTLSSD